MYSNYDFYISRGGTMSETEYKAAAEKAAEKIDYYTFGRAANAPDKMRDRIKRCECALADILRSAEKIPFGISSESNDGVSVSYLATAQQDSERQIQNICRQYLCFPVNLMYAGGDGLW